MNIRIFIFSLAAALAACAGSAATLACKDSGTTFAKDALQPFVDACF